MTLRRSLVSLTLVALAIPAVLAAEAAAPNGKALYEKKCGPCHGANGVAKSTAKGSKNLNDPEWQKATTDDAIEHDIMQGKGKMKPVKLKPEEVHAVIAHIRTLK